MPYMVHTSDAVEEYLCAIPDLSADGLRRVVDAYLRDLGEHADDFLRETPVAHESYRFQYELVLRDGAFLYHFRFIADGSGMPYGIVSVIYVDCERSAIQPLP